VSEHDPNCDVNDINPEGIKKPCNCGVDFILLCCPWCGHFPTVRECDPRTHRFMVHCGNPQCHVNPEAQGMGMAMAIVRWNRRLPYENWKATQPKDP
jgi:hypothetical protein